MCIERPNRFIIENKAHSVPTTEWSILITQTHPSCNVRVSSYVQTRDKPPWKPHPHPHKGECFTISTCYTMWPNSLTHKTPQSLIRYSSSCSTTTKSPTSWSQSDPRFDKDQPPIVEHSNMHLRNKHLTITWMQWLSAPNRTTSRIKIVNALNNAKVSIYSKQKSSMENIILSTDSPRGKKGQPITHNG